jgi:hypothetical protein
MRFLKSEGIVISNCGFKAAKSCTISVRLGFALAISRET